MPCMTSESLKPRQVYLYRGKKYKKLKSSKEIEDDMKKYEPFLVTSVNYPCVPLLLATILCFLAYVMICLYIEAGAWIVDAIEIQMNNWSFCFAGQCFFAR